MNEVRVRLEYVAAPVGTVALRCNMDHDRLDTWQNIWIDSVYAFAFWAEKPARDYFGRAVQLGDSRTTHQYRQCLKCGRLDDKRAAERHASCSEPTTTETVESSHGNPSISGLPIGFDWERGRFEEMRHGVTLWIGTLDQLPAALANHFRAGNHSIERDDQRVPEWLRNSTREHVQY